MKKEMTFDDFIALCDRIANVDYKCGDWWPDVVDIQTKLEPKLEQNLEFLIWVSETASEPKTDKQKESRKYINNLINSAITFTDEGHTDNSVRNNTENKANAGSAEV